MAFNIWRFTDGKPGHDSQSIGLCAAIEKQISCHCFDIPIAPVLKNIGCLLSGRFPLGADLPDPNFIIGAGHGTHLAMLAARKTRKGKIIVLMKPSLPLSCFDVCIIPQHDLVSEKNNVITTVGALNPIQFSHKKSAALGLILLGGLSKHYHWDSEAIITQIDTIISHNPEIKWSIADSPRTPDTVLDGLHKKSYNNLRILRFAETDRTKIHALIYNASPIWVTRDSISMIYEALSSGASVGLIDLPQKKNNRLQKGIDDLVKKGLVTIYDESNARPALDANTTVFNEARRCAKLLLDREILR